MLDIFSNVLKSWDYSTYGQNGHDVNRLAILGRKRSKSQPLRVRFAVNNRGKAFFGNPSNTVIMTISKAACEINPEVFNPAYIGRFIKMSCYK